MLSKDTLHNNIEEEGFVQSSKAMVEYYAGAKTSTCVSLSLFLRN